MSNENELLSCPFCGAEADTCIFDNIVNVGCPECNVRTRYESLDCVDVAVETWNTRTDGRRECTVRHMTALDQKINLVEMITWGKCEACLGLAVPGMNYCPNCGAKVVSAE